ncbi:hypothetical protein S245_036915 [Arachis hypogaea]|nr:uncharacterized protein DS421_11g332070 [Arachis hypogaea]
MAYRQTRCRSSKRARGLRPRSEGSLPIFTPLISSRPDTSRSGVEVGASVKEKREEHGSPDSATNSRAVTVATGTEDPRMSGGGFYRVSPIMFKPPLLTTAVFPWDRDDET